MIMSKTVSLHRYVCTVLQIWAKMWHECTKRAHYYHYYCHKKKNDAMKEQQKRTEREKEENNKNKNNFLFNYGMTFYMQISIMQMNSVVLKGIFIFS